MTTETTIQRFKIVPEDEPPYGIPGYWYVFDYLQRNVNGTLGVCVLGPVYKSLAEKFVGNRKDDVVYVDSEEDVY